MGGGGLGGALRGSGWCSFCSRLASSVHSPQLTYFCKTLQIHTSTETILAYHDGQLVLRRGLAVNHR
ncbi:hypothetical protein SBA1_280036 [Candidatus Sulfotelmatobacter kueseliae]|uniref:Uncharacterized protein n=1 Tax=Candidatus Sulfotelmatobacter kueseliae TaxID=2042962 RepID=A0A2U3KIX8_9BACT|nr:hypothetical protein SBA1_280036 [Candidatus Sulfotelmatobacter kueseliae]